MKSSSQSYSRRCWCSVRCDRHSVICQRKKHSVTLPTDVKVNGTQVKHGDYDLVFDEQTW